MPDDDAGLQQEVDAWLQRNWDPDLTVREWWERVGDAGWTAPHFSLEWGGRGYSRRSLGTVYKAFRANGKPKLVLVISGGQVLANALEILLEIEETRDVKIVAVTSPQLYEELRQKDPRKAQEILADDERQYVVALHNGWKGFLYPFLMPADAVGRAFGMDEFSRSGKPPEIYHHAGFDAAGLREKILGRK